MRSFHFVSYSGWFRFLKFVLDPLVSLLQQGSLPHRLTCFFAVCRHSSGANRDDGVHPSGLTLEVAPECSSIRSSMMLLVTIYVL